MKTLLLLAALLVLLAQVPGQAILSTPAGWTPGTLWVPSALKVNPDGTQPLAITVSWASAVATPLGIPDPRLATLTEVWLTIAPGPIWDPSGWLQTPYGLAISLTPLAILTVHPGDWEAFQSPSGPVLEAASDFGTWPVPQGLEWSLQALIVHRFGAPDVAYLSAPVPVWL